MFDGCIVIYIYIYMYVCMYTYIHVWLTDFMKPGRVGPESLMSEKCSPDSGTNMNYNVVTPYKPL